MRSMNLILIASALVMAFALYKIKYDALAATREITVLKAEIVRERDTINILRAEWSHLVQPERLETLSRKFLELDVLSADQIVRLVELPAGATVTDPYANQPTIGDLMQELRLVDGQQ